jgi:5-methyltetrahydropteroyltriglutamate--homocysteine methyltransferase
MPFFFDDAGSWPLMQGIDKDRLTEMAFARQPSYIELVKKAMEEKLEAGLQVPTYPQLQNMCEQFLFLLRKDEFCGENPYGIREEFALIPELGFLDDVARRYYERNGERLLLRVCVTGAVELHLYEFGKQIDEALLRVLSESVNAFLKNSLLDTKYAKTQVVSIDDPSVGLIDLNAEEDIIIKAWEIAASGLSCDVQVHLHSPLAANLAAHARGVDVVSAETASHPEYMDLLDKSLLVQNDKYLRIGITRTDFDRMASEYNEEYNTNVFMQKDCHRIIAERETPLLIKNRLERAYERFGGLIKYTGTDCGLKSAGTREAASLLLRNTRKVIDEFRREHQKI